MAGILAAKPKHKASSKKSWLVSKAACNQSTMSKFEALAERELAKRKGDTLSKENDEDNDSAASDAEEGWTEARLDERSFEDGQRNTQELSAEEVALDQAGMREKSCLMLWSERESNSRPCLLLPLLLRVHRTRGWPA